MSQSKLIVEVLIGSNSQSVISSKYVNLFPLATYSVLLKTSSISFNCKRVNNLLGPHAVESV